MRITPGGMERLPGHPMRFDQAEGLRRLLVRKQPQVVAVVGGKPGLGCTSTTINLAAALAHSGKDVLVLDENHGPHALFERMKLASRFDLLDVAQGRCAPGAAILDACGFSVASAARVLSASATLQPDERQRLENALTEISREADVMLVDAAMPGRQSGGSKMQQAAISSSLMSGATLLVVADATVGGITESYALIKRLALENARVQFDIIVNKVASEQAAMTVFSNMAAVARSNLAVHLEYLGYIPSDEKLKRAAQLGRTVIDAFPDAASARSCHALSQNLLRLPVRMDESEGGVDAVIQNLMRQVGISGRGAVVQKAA